MYIEINIVPFEFAMEWSCLLCTNYDNASADYSKLLWQIVFWGLGLYLNLNFEMSFYILKYNFLLLIFSRT